MGAKRHTFALMADEIRIHVRIAAELKERVQELSRVTGLDEATLVRKSLESIAQYFDEHGELTVPFVLLPKSALKKGSKTVALPAQSGRSDAPVALPVNPSTDSTRFSVNEPAPAYGPRPRSTRAGVKKTIERER